jgi:hypothetical protein
VSPSPFEGEIRLRTILSFTPIIKGRPMKKTHLLLCGVASVAVFLSHCTTTTYPTSPPPSTSATNATLTVLNNSSLTVGWVYMSTSSGTLGTDWLGISTVPVGSSYDIFGISPGTYYLRAVHSTTHDTAFNTLTLASGQTYTWTLTDASFTPISGGTLGLTIVNNSSYAIDYVYLSQSSSTWGSDWLGSVSISPGYNYTIPNEPTGYVNTKMVCSDATKYALHLLYIPSSGIDTIWVDDTDFPSYAHGSIKIINTSSTTIYYLYMRASGTTTWSSDQLGISTIDAGEQHQLNLLDPGTYDFRVESSGHTYAAEVDNQVITGAQLLTWTVSAMY